MQNQPLKAFDFQGSQVRTVLKDGEPWFCAADVCACLEIREAKDAAARLDEDERGRFEIATLGDPQNLAFVTEAGLYTLVLGSRKPEDLQEFGPNGRPPPQPISTGAGWLIIYKDGRWIEAYGVDAEYRGNDPDFLIAIPFSSLKAATGSEHGH